MFESKVGSTTSSLLITKGYLALCKYQLRYNCNFKCSVPGTCSGEDVRKEERRLEEEEQNRYQLLAICQPHYCTATLTASTINTRA